MPKKKSVSLRPIDRFDNSELEALSLLENEVFSEFDEHLEMRVAKQEKALSLEEIKKLFREKKCRGFVIQEGKALMGYLAFEIEDKAFRVRRIVVDGEHHKEGFGSTLLDYLFERAMLDDKRRKVVASIPEQYMGCAAFFSHQGFSVKIEKLNMASSDILECELTLEEIIP